ASHNPAQWNGLKLFGPDGAVLNERQGREIQAIYESGSLRRVSWEELGTGTECRNAEDWHRDRVLQLVDVVRIRARGLGVFLDANGGGGGAVGRGGVSGFSNHARLHTFRPRGVFLPTAGAEHAAMSGAVRV